MLVVAYCHPYQLNGNLTNVVTKTNVKKSANNVRGDRTSILNDWVGGGGGGVLELFVDFLDFVDGTWFVLEFVTRLYPLNPDTTVLTLLKLSSWAHLHFQR